jgi:hypothetical protein
MSAAEEGSALGSRRRRRLRHEPMAAVLAPAPATPGPGAGPHPPSPIPAALEHTVPPVEGGSGGGSTPEATGAGSEAPAVESEGDGDGGPGYPDPAQVMGDLRAWAVHVDGELRFPCPYCDYHSTRSDNTKRHISYKHLVVKPFQCEACESTFVTKYDLENHARVHSGEKPYVCTHCGSQFAKATNLAVHKRKARQRAAVLVAAAAGGGGGGPGLAPSGEAAGKPRKRGRPVSHVCFPPDEPPPELAGGLEATGAGSRAVGRVGRVAGGPSGAAAARQPGRQPHTPPGGVGAPAIRPSHAPHTPRRPGSHGPRPLFAGARAPPSDTMHHAPPDAVGSGGGGTEAGMHWQSGSDAPSRRRGQRQPRLPIFPDDGQWQPPSPLAGPLHDSGTGSGSSGDRVAGYLESSSVGGGGGGGGGGRGDHDPSPSWHAGTPSNVAAARHLGRRGRRGSLGLGPPPFGTSASLDPEPYGATHLPPSLGWGSEGEGEGEGGGSGPGGTNPPHSPAVGPVGSWLGVGVPLDPFLAGLGNGSPSLSPDGGLALPTAGDHPHWARRLVVGDDPVLTSGEADGPTTSMTPEMVGPLGATAPPTVCPPSHGGALSSAAPLVAAVVGWLRHGMPAPGMPALGQGDDAAGIPMPTSVAVAGHSPAVQVAPPVAGTALEIVLPTDIAAPGTPALDIVLPVDVATMGSGPGASGAGAGAAVPWPVPAQGGRRGVGHRASSASAGAGAGAGAATLPSSDPAGAGGRRSTRLSVAGDAGMGEWVDT